MTIHVHIDRIVLDGVALGVGGVPRLKAAIEQELARLLAADDGATWSGGATHSLGGGTLDLADTPAAPELGRRIARAAFEGMRRDAPPNASVKKAPGQGASPQTVPSYGEAMQRSHGVFFHEPDEFAKKAPGQGASPATVLSYGDAMQRSHGDFFHEPDEFAKKAPGQGASPQTVPSYGEAMQRSHGDFFTNSTQREASYEP